MLQTQSIIKADHVKNYTTPLDLQLLYTISKPIRSKTSKTYQNKLFYNRWFKNNPFCLFILFISAFRLRYVCFH